MDFIQLFADVIHLFAIITLILKIMASRSISGLSLKTQVLFLMVFCLRYIDIFFGIKTYYMTIMKIIFVVATAFTVYLMKFKKPYCLSYDEAADTFPFYVLFIIALVLTIFIHKAFYWQDLFWSYSIWL